MTLQELFDTIMTKGAMTDSRKGPIRTAVKQYAEMLGIPSSECPPESYHLPPQARRRLIESRAPAHLGPRAIANLKDNIGWLIRKGVELKLIEPLERPLPSWRKTPNVGVSWWPRRRDSQTLPKDHYCLRPLPARLADEVRQYAAWCTNLYAPGRPAYIKKRPVSLNSTYRAVEGIAGFLVLHEQRDPQSLTLRELTQPDAVSAFVTWWINRRGQVTRTILQLLAQLKIIVDYWLKDHASAQVIAQIRRSLGSPDPVYDPRQRTLSRQELDRVGQAIYPLNAQRLTESYRARRVRNGTPCSDYNGTQYALWVELSLIIRLLSWIPFRQRQIREMQRDRNLYPRPDGTWEIRFRGPELKIARRDGQENELTYDFPLHLQGLLEEWLTHWRPCLIKTTECPFVFVNRHGQPWTREWLTLRIEKATFKFGGVAVNPHMFRHIWATEYIKSTKDMIGAAKWLGNTVAVVMKHYAHLLDADAAKGPTQWMQAQLDPDK
jgi:integrase